MRILMAAMEMAPFLEVGGVAEVVTEWCRALDQLGHRVTAVLPVTAAGAPPPPPWLDLQVLAVPGCSPLDPYGLDHDDAGPRADRLARLADGVIGLCKQRAAAGEPFDVLHVNEWPLAMVPYLLRHRSYGFTPPRTVLTIHCLAHQGLLLPEMVTEFGLSMEHARPIYEEGVVSLLQAGVLAADAVTTPSPTYAQKLCSSLPDPELPSRLCRAASLRPNPVRGILHGLDDTKLDPANDEALPARFDAGDLTGRATCKAVLGRKLGLSAEAPWILSAGRLSPEKGTEALIEALPALIELGAQVLIAGAGHYEEVTRAALLGLPPGRVAFVGWASSPLLRLLLAAADLLVVPSMSESCGLTQMQGQRYGVVPVARRTGGLSDTIVDHTEGSSQSTGFLYDGVGKAPLVAAVERALAVYRTPVFREIQARAMMRRWSWMEAARQYESVYRGEAEPVRQAS